MCLQIFQYLCCVQGLIFIWSSEWGEREKNLHPSLRQTEEMAQFGKNSLSAYNELVIP